ncbi:transcription repressor OFP17-like [Phragmites australis]|uniref:transcription repressor OFP17-like n=1 Tax=Phragmites australis TaxID=29695 RepID=UPI002D798AC6|nr:transcription repressor OFP17-like [Phragmites australis]
MSVSSSHHHPPSCVTCSLLAACRRALTQLFRIPASTALPIRAFRFRKLRKAAARMSSQPRRRRQTFRSIRAVFWPLVPPPASAAEGDAERGAVLEAPAPEMSLHAPMPSPETPAYVKVVARLQSGRSASGDGEEEEACRSFESCLMEMLVEEGKARDLQDVEELLRCWERLKSPVFVELVCRFYGELCNDMFPAVRGDDGTDRDGGDASVPTSTA